MRKSFRKLVLKVSLYMVLGFAYVCEQIVHLCIWHVDRRWLNGNLDLGEYLMKMDSLLSNLDEIIQVIEDIKNSIELCQ